MSSGNGKVTDTIPRASIRQIVQVLGHAASAGKSSFEEIRRLLYASSGRRSPASETALWTVARDVLTELQRLDFARIGILPRRRSDVSRLRESPCEVTKRGKELAEIHAAKPGQAFDALLLAWMNIHPYFRALMVRVTEAPLYVPDVTSAAQLGEARAANELSSAIARNCLDRLSGVGFHSRKAATLDQGIRKRIEGVAESLSSADMDSKKLVDLVQDTVVIPSFLEAEGLPFDSVTFQHLLKIAGEFFAAASTTSFPDFAGRVVFSTCDFTPNPLEFGKSIPSGVEHHGLSFARPHFSRALVDAYGRVAGTSGGYADIYRVRAIVCVELKVQPPVFAGCLTELINAGESADPAVYTELPFTPPPQGETYVVVRGRRIGRIKLRANHGA